MIKSNATATTDLTEVERAARKARRAENTRKKIRRAAECFVYRSKNVETIAEIVNTSPMKVFQWSRTSTWHKTLHQHGYDGKDRHPKWQTHLHPKVPYTLSEKFLLKKIFQEDGEVRLVTYDGMLDTKIKDVMVYHIELPDKTKISKVEVLLAFPKNRMPDVKRGIKLRKKLAEQNLKPIIKVKERPNIDHSAEVGDKIEAVMRNGLIVTGIVIHNSVYNIVLRVGGTKEEGGKVVLLYPHGLHGFKVIETPPEDRTTKTSPPADA